VILGFVGQNPEEREVRKGAGRGRREERGLILGGRGIIKKKKKKTKNKKK
jgi:hypothetical protein